MQRLLSEVRKGTCSGLSLSGGDPLCRRNAPDVARVCRRVKEECPGKSIWCWTGHRLEDILEDEGWREPLKWVDAVVDGPFIEGLADPWGLKWRGSSNQRIFMRTPQGLFADCTDEISRRSAPPSG